MLQSLFACFLNGYKISLLTVHKILCQWPSFESKETWQECYSVPQITPPPKKVPSLLLWGDKEAHISMVKVWVQWHLIDIYLQRDWQRCWHGMLTQNMSWDVDSKHAASPPAFLRSALERVFWHLPLPSEWVCVYTCFILNVYVPLWLPLGSMLNCEWLKLFLNLSCPAIF